MAAARCKFLHRAALPIEQVSYANDFIDATNYRRYIGQCLYVTVNS